MLSQYKHHSPYIRVISGEPTVEDRQWLRFLRDVFADVSHERLVSGGMDPLLASEILGVSALDIRFTAEDNESEL